MPKPQVVIESKYLFELGGDFYAELTPTECNVWGKHLRQTHRTDWAHRELAAEMVQRARQQGAAGALRVVHKVFLDADWAVHELAEAWYAELEKARAAADETDKGD